MSAFATTASLLRDSKFVIPITFAVLLGIIIGAFAFYEDYQSSLHGYGMLPTRKSGQEITQVIALLPQIGQIIFFYMFGRTVEILPSGKRRINYLYFMIAFFLLLFDFGTDMYFKAFGLPAYVWLIAFIESITIFTIGSEMLLTASLGIFLELAPEALKQLGQLFSSILVDDDDQPQAATRRA